MRPRLCALLLVTFVHSVNAQWIYHPTGSNDLLKAVSFSGRNNGFVVGRAYGGYQSLILHTTDGGSTWSRQLPGAAGALNGVFAADSLHVTAVGEGGMVFRSTDGGLSWTVTRPTYALLNGVCFTDVNHGIAVGYSTVPDFYSTILQTTDGGASWIDKHVSTFEPLLAVSFFNHDTGLVVGGAGTAFRTTDGGNSWNLLPATNQSNMYSIAFSSLGIAIAVGDQNVLRSTDLGLSWTASSADNGYLAVSCHGPDTALAVGDKFLRWSTDAGLSWSVFATDVTLYGATVIDGGMGWAAGYPGTILNSVGPGYPPPLPVQVSPDSDDVAVPLEVNNSQSFGRTVRWRFYPYTRFLPPPQPTTPTRYTILLSADSTFAGADGRPYTWTLPDGRLGDTSVFVPHLWPRTTYYWRAGWEVINSGLNPVYSGSWKFTTADYPASTIAWVQQVPQASLEDADRVQNSNGYYSWGDQSSPLNNQFVLLEARCISPPLQLGTLRQWTLIACDTGSSTAPWHEVIMAPSPYLLPSSLAALESLRPGDIVLVQGRVTETPTNNMNSNTSLSLYDLKKIGSSEIPSPPLTASIADFDTGTFGMVRYSRGEKYEGAIVELHNVSVHSVSNASAGTLNLIDALGNTLPTSDLSPWFTLRSHRNPASSYAVPPVGARIDTLRGLIVADGSSYRIAPLLPGDMVLGPQPRAKIVGTIYDDRNHDGHYSPTDRGISSWTVSITGRVATNLVTDAQGNFSLSGLDSGTYSLSITAPLNWTLESPRILTVRLGPADSSAGNNFLCSYPWNSISGTVYRDWNENGTRDPGEPGVKGLTVRFDGSNFDTTLTDSTGAFLLSAAPGPSTVSLSLPQSWEQITPLLNAGYSGDVQTYSESYPGRDFGVRPSPQKIRIAVSVNDADSLNDQRFVWFGIRPGASYGIWGTDPRSRPYDFSEGEFEIPPQSYGVFDARFEDPSGSLSRFGYGSWTDIRDFFSPAETDSFRLTFRPGYFSGGDYPMTITWSREDFVKNFSGAALLVPPGGSPVDMKVSGSARITNPAIIGVTIVTKGPNLPGALARSWQMVSLPQKLAKSAISYLYPSSAGTAFFYDHGAYQLRDSVSPGSGFWLKYSPLIDSLLLTGTSRNLDTITVSAGWNLIGSLSSSVDYRSATSIPAGIIGSYFFGYSRGYTIADSLRPLRGYWVRMKDAGKIVLNASPAGLKVSEILNRCYSLLIKNPSGDECRLYVTDSLADSQDFSLPPAPPGESFDARFASGRMLESLGSASEKTFALRVTSAPVSLEWSAPAMSFRPLHASLKSGSRVTALGEGKEVFVKNSQELFVKVSRGAYPEKFSLGQNYPNPFNPSTSIPFSLQSRAKVSITIYDLLGREVKVLVNEFFDGGEHETVWDGAGRRGDPVSSGIYFCRMTAVVTTDGSSFARTLKMVVVR